jgi:hypothetical protein
LPSLGGSGLVNLDFGTQQTGGNQRTRVPIQGRSYPSIYRIDLTVVTAQLMFLAVLEFSVVKQTPKLGSL